MKTLIIDDIDFGDNKPAKVPYGERKHIAFLIGSGFSVSYGMPTRMPAIIKFILI